MLSDAEVLPLIPKGRVPSLDGLRAISIAFVMWGHACATIPAGHVARIARFLSRFMDAQVGVSIFFVISGYLITSILVREQDGKGRINLGAFYVRRVFRILPALYAYIAIVAALGLMGAIPLHLSDVLAAALFVWNYVGSNQWFLGHTWSLSVEEQFYLFWPILFAFLGRRRASRVALAIIVALPVVRVLNYQLVPSLRARIPIMGHTRADTLMFGCLISLLANETRFRTLLARLDRWKAHVLAAITLFLLEPFVRERFTGTWQLPVGYTLEGVCIAIIIVRCVRFPTSGLAPLLNRRAVMYVGALSYSLYLWQQLFLTQNNRTWTGRFPANVGCAFVAALLSFYLIERPAIRFRVWLTRDRRPAGPAI